MTLSLEEIKSRVREAHGTQVELVEWTYKSSGEKCVFIDCEFGSWSTIPKTVMKGMGHPERGKKKKLATMKERYGYEYPYQVPSIKEKFKGTMMERHGVEWPFQSEEIRKHAEDKHLKNHGVKNPMQRRDVQMKVALSNNKSTKFLHWKTKEELVCQASYEVGFVNWANFNKIDFDWQISCMMPDGRCYFIDARLKSGPFTGTWVEIKGYQTDDRMPKWEWFHSEHPTSSQLWTRTNLEELGILIRGKPNPSFVQ